MTPATAYRIIGVGCNLIVIPCLWFVLSIAP